MSKSGPRSVDPYEGGVPDDETWGMDEDELRETYSYSDRVMLKLQSLGLNSTNRPVVSDEMARVIGTLKQGEYFDGRLPNSLRGLSFDDLSDLHVLMVNWMHYLTNIMNEVIVERSQAKAQKESIFSVIRMKNAKNAKRFAKLSLSDQRLSDLARYDRRWVHDHQKYLELNALHECIEALIKVAEQNTQVISREVTRREAAINAEGRGRNIEYRRERHPIRNATGKKIKGSFGKGRTYSED